VDGGSHPRRNDCIIGQLIEAPNNFGNVIFVVGCHRAASRLLCWPQDEVLGVRCRETQNKLFLCFCV